MWYSGRCGGQGINEVGEKQGADQFARPSAKKQFLEDDAAGAPDLLDAVLERGGPVHQQINDLDAILVLEENENKSHHGNATLTPGQTASGAACNDSKGSPSLRVYDSSHIEISPEKAYSSSLVKSSISQIRQGTEIHSPSMTQHKKQIRGRNSQRQGPILGSPRQEIKAKEMKRKTKTKDVLQPAVGEDLPNL